MPRVHTVPADTPLAERLVAGLTYPLRGGGLAICAVLALGQCLVLIPAYVGVLFAFVLWTATWRYAAACMMHTANGFADPPDVGVEENPAAGHWLTVVHMAVIIACAASTTFYPAMFWPLILLFALTLPAIDMSLAFDGNPLVALNPLNWQSIIGRLGAGYFIPVILNVVIGGLMVLPSPSLSWLPFWLSLPLFAFAYTYLIIFNLHLMGAMIHQRHEQFDLEPEAETLARESGQDEDEHLLTRVREMAKVDRRAAIRMLVERMQGRSAPASLHQAYRELLRKEGLTDGLIEHGHLWIAALMMQGDTRRALALTQECVDIDPAFLPDAPDSAAALAEHASRAGMTRLSLKLCRGYLARWPRSSDCPRVGLLAANQMADRLGQRAEAAVLLGKLAAAWPNHPLHPTLVALASRMQQAGGTTHASAVD
ncbi:hypothetical protein [Dyella japonica]|uniref:Uncharacterized protein n=1 Tax=Dyella japonica A8 TaxID=1217721 RepID=A0A075K3F6_9GAMM|nr:hypothetical protein [Dyella japonica]AIF48575.1 hypothetical protein HY57_15700 [Dyella japonica A8]